MWKQLTENLGQTGSEGGRILKDEEYREQCRITLERCKAYDAITCGVYGDMVHTAFADPAQAPVKYEAMKKELQDFIDRNIEDMEERSEFYEAFMDRYC